MTVATRSGPAAAVPDAPTGAGMHVLLLSYTFQPEPGVVRGLPLAVALRDRGYRVSVLTAFPQYPLGRVYDGYRMRWRQWERMEGIDVLRVPIYPSHDRSAARRMLTYISFMVSAALIGVPLLWRRGRIDIVYHSDNLPSTGVVAALIARLHGGASIQHIADLWPDSVTESGMLRGATKRMVSGLLGAWCSFVYRRNAAMTVLSPGFKRTLVARGVPSESIDVIYNWAADESQFFPAAPDPELRRELGLDGKFAFVYAGNLGPLQGLDALIRAAALVRDELPNVVIALIGVGPAEQELRALAQQLDATNVHFLPRRPVSEMNAINNVADVLLVSLRDIPMMRTTIPSKTQVSLASGRPVLMAAAGDAADLLESAGAGIAVRPGDPEGLADAIRRMARLSPDELRKMGRSGRAYYDAHLSLASGVDRTDALFRAVGAPRGGRHG